MIKQSLIFILILISLSTYGQRGEWQDITLKDMSNFRPQAGNWFIVGEVQMDPNRDIHPKPINTGNTKAEGSKKKRKKKKGQSPVVPSSPVTYQSGQGILLNMNKDTLKDHLISTWEHGDLELELEVMMPKGSNSGIYLQGRYEVQLYDSWGVKDPSFSDIGGIYRNWETDSEKIYMGKAPISNPAKAPGLWQKMHIVFQAPKFDASGKKIAPAKFISVDLNGVRIHENVTVPKPTGGPIDKREVTQGPLKIQGDHGAVAFRNIRYRKLNQRPLKFDNISYKIYKGNFTGLEDLKNTEPLASGHLDRLTCDFDQPLEEPFIVVYQGNLQTQVASTYPLRFNCTGSIEVAMNGNTLGSKVYPYTWAMNQVLPLDINLQKGNNELTLIYHKADGGRSPRLGMYSLDSYAMPLHAFNSYPPGGSGPNPIYVEPGQQTRLLRAFIDFEGDRAQRLTHTIGVGNPSGTHFIYDLKTGSPVCVWRGEFINATPMWHRRGDGSFRPKGAAQFLFKGHSFALAKNLDEDDAFTFPQSLNESQGFKNKGYKIDESTGLPTFMYQIDSLAIEDRLVPEDEGKSLRRYLKFMKLNPEKGIYIKLAEGKNIFQMPDGSYVIDQKYYIKLPTGLSPEIRNVQSKAELVINNKSESINYSIIW